MRFLLRAAEIATVGHIWLVTVKEARREWCNILGYTYANLPKELFLPRACTLCSLYPQLTPPAE